MSDDPAPYRFLESKQAKWLLNLKINMARKFRFMGEGHSSFGNVGMSWKSSTIRSPERRSGSSGRYGGVREGKHLYGAGSGGRSGRSSRCVSELISARDFSTSSMRTCSAAGLATPVGSMPTEVYNTILRVS